MLTSILKFSWTCQIFRRVFYKGMSMDKIKEVQKIEIVKLTNYGINEADAEKRLEILVKDMNT